jgi:hypothetical protein
MHIDCSYVLWRVELTAGMIIFEHFGSKVYLFGLRWAFGAAYGGRGWETSTPHMQFNTGSPPNGLKIACAACRLGGRGGVEML